MSKQIYQGVYANTPHIGLTPIIKWQMAKTTEQKLISQLKLTLEASLLINDGITKW